MLGCDNRLDYQRSNHSQYMSLIHDGFLLVTYTSMLKLMMGNLKILWSQERLFRYHNIQLKTKGVHLKCLLDQSRFLKFYIRLVVRLNETPLN